MLLGYVTLALAGVWGKTVTTDEPHHLEYSRQRLLEGTYARWIPGKEMSYDSKMPVSMPNAAVSVLLDRLSSPPSAAVRLFLERMPTVAWAVIGALYTFLFALRLFGLRAAWLGLGLFLTEPNILAHSALITTDVACTAWILGSLYHLHRYLDAPTAKNAVILGAVTGMAQVAKYSSVALLPMFAVITVVRSWMDKRRLPPGRAPVPGRRQRTLGHLLLFGVVLLLVINAAFAFEGFLLPYPEKPPDPAKLDNFGRIAPALRAAASIIRPALGILPKPYIQGLSMVTQSDRVGPGPYVFVLGQLTDHGVPWYFVVVGAFKIPLPVLILFAGSLILMITRRFRGAGDVVLFLLGPILVTFWSLSFGLNHQLGIRYMLPLLPLVIITGGGFLAWSLRPTLLRAALLGLLAWQGVSTGFWFGNWLSYTNELVPDKTQAWRLFAESNLQWGQDDGALQDYLARHPEESLVVDPGAATSGRLVVGVNELVGASDRGDYFMHDRYAWLRDNFVPTRRITHSFLVFDVPADRVTALYDRAINRSGARDFPRTMVQKPPPWAKEAEVLPTLSLKTRPRESADHTAEVEVDVELRGSTAKLRPWNVWLEELGPGSSRRLASDVHLVKVGQGSPRSITVRLRPSAPEALSITAWVGIFPDRFVASASTTLR